MLAVLVDNSHRVVSRGELSRLAGLEGLSERRCDSVLVQIRRHLGPDALTTVRGPGLATGPVSAGSGARRARLIVLVERRLDGHVLAHVAGIGAPPAGRTPTVASRAVPAAAAIAPVAATSRRRQS